MEIESAISETIKGIPAPTAAVLATPTTDDKRGAQRLIDHTNSTLTKAYDVTVSHIDEMIAKLQRIKTAIECKRDQTREKIADFIKTVDQGLQGIEELDEQISKLEEQHL
jgi:hypothetical protein